MSNYRNAMRRMRQYTAAVKKNYNSRETELEKLFEYKGSVHYDKEIQKVNERIEQERVRLATGAKDDLMAVIKEMRKNVGNRITKAPSTDMVNTLALLGMLDTVSPTDIKQYAIQMSECPLAMKRLQQIAKGHNMQIIAPDTDAMMRAIDVLEGNFAMYIQGYTGDDHSMSASVKQLYEFFQPEETYMNTPVKSSKNVDSIFWQKVVGIGSPSILENENNTSGSTDVKYFFDTLDGLVAFINKQTVGLEDKAYTDKVNEILADCPGQYGAAYRYYKATGEKVPLIEAEEEIQ